ncbi:MAG: HDIG domain-containing protein [Chloroflexi bacterium]|nr:HDIG domain-containing protein [Chloroflexota bacterium]
MKRPLSGASVLVFLRHQSLAAFVRSPLARAVAFFFILVTPLTAILTFQLLPNRFAVETGQPAPQTIKSAQRVTFVSQIRTKDAREQAAARVPQVLTHDPNVATIQINTALEIMRRIGDLVGDSAKTATQKRDAIADLTTGIFSTTAAAQVAAMDRATWQSVSVEAARLLDQAMRQRISADQLAETRLRLADRASLQLPPEQTRLAVEMAGAFVKANMFPDEPATEAKRREARDAVKPVRLTIEKGEVILRDGDIVKPVDMEAMEAAGLLHQEVEWQDVTGIALLASIASLGLTAWIAVFRRRLLASDRQVFLVAILVVVTVLAAKLTIPGRDPFAYLFPLAAVPMLIAVLLDGQLAIMVAAVLAVLGTVAAGGQLDLATLYLAGSVAGLLLVWRAERLNRFFFGGLAVALTQFLVLAAFSLIQGERAPSQFLLYAFLALVSGGLAAALTVGTFALLGQLFGITTSLQLLELAHPSQPLLRLLMTEAPGTYHHSVIVANLAERAAEAVGADSLLVRVGCYYHDIGKALRPGFFVENQLDGESVHDLMNPTTSARMILAHVSDGLTLARRYRLPLRVREFVAEHHGTRLVTYFYDRALQQNGRVDPESFRYPGPRPKSKETAIAMLADAIEACARAAKDHSPESIGEIVDQIVGQRLKEGELDECDLTLHDLAVIRATFKRVLKGVYHPRIEYPSVQTLSEGVRTVSEPFPDPSQEREPAVPRSEPRPRA